MKRILSLILAMAFICSMLAACEKKGAESDIKESASGTVSSEEIKTVEGELTAQNYGDFIELCDYKKIKLDWDKEPYKGYLSSALSSYTPEKKKITNRPIKNGDTANIDYKGIKDGVAFEGGTAEGHDLKIGSGSFIPGFEEGLIGVKSGESKDIKLTFPEEYHSAELAGQEVIFKVKVNSITVESYKDEDMLSAKKSVASKSFMNYILEESEFKALPEALLNSYISEMTDYYKQSLASQYGSFESFLSSQNMTQADFDAQIKEGATIQAKYDVAALAIGEKENLSVSDKDYKEALNQYASQSGTTAEEFEKQNGKDKIQTSLLREKVGEKLAAINEIK